MDNLFTAARSWIYQHARPIDLMRFRFHFEGGRREDVLDALAAYQNPDGGFGHALEADCWNPASSPLQTWCAAELLHEIGFTDSSHPIIAGMIRYLTSCAAFDGEQWYTALRSNRDHPHAPWWQTDADCHWSDNPTACLAGFLLLHCPDGSDGYRLGLRCATASATRLTAGDDQHDMHALRCFIRLLEYAQAADAPLDVTALQAILRLRIDQAVTRNPDEWETAYCCRPSQLIDRANSPYAAGFDALCAAECRFIRQTQQLDGAWLIPWRWDAYPAEWAVSRLWWQGDAIIRNLLFLREFEEEPQWI